MNGPFPIDAVRARFPGLAREVAGRPAVFFDGPAGSQVPRTVLDAVESALVRYNANLTGAFATSVECDQMMSSARRAMVDLLGADDAQEIVFGANMTTLTFALSRALASTWEPEDEVVVTRLDHDANVAPWVEAAGLAGARVRHVDIVADDCALNMDDLDAKLNARTRLVAVGGGLQPGRDHQSGG